MLLLDVTTELGELERVAAEIASFANDEQLNPDITFRLNLIIEELFVNAIHHGHESGAGVVQIEVVSTSAGLAVTLRDHGPRFDPLTIPTPDVSAPLEERQVGGLGIHFVRELSTDVHYERSDGQNIIRLTIPSCE